MSVLYGRLYRLLRSLWTRFPLLRPGMSLLNRLVRLRAPMRFQGWGMTTQHELPWRDEYQWDSFRESMELAKELNFTGEAGIDRAYLEQLAWRHWVVAFATRYVLEMAEGSPGDFVECGVADGTTAFFALRELEERCSPGKGPRVHLYDAWERMDETALLPSEQAQQGRYGRLEEDLARRNLAAFAHRVQFHRGYIPASFHAQPASPTSVSYLHIDLNAAAPTLATLEFFWPRLRERAVILFDDYGWFGFEDTKRIIDAFLADKPGILLKMPTAQALFLRR